MPIYEYECANENKVFEAMQKFSDAPLTTCPDCGAEVKKIMSRTSFTLKGAGWYTTDYKPAGKTASASGTEVSGSKPEKPKTSESQSTNSTATPAAAPASSTAQTTPTAAPASTN